MSNATAMVLDEILQIRSDASCSQEGDCNSLDPLLDAVEESPMDEARISKIVQKAIGAADLPDGDTIDRDLKVASEHFDDEVDYLLDSVVAPTFEDDKVLRILQRSGLTPVAVRLEQIEEQLACCLRELSVIREQQAAQLATVEMKLRQQEAQIIELALIAKRSLSGQVNNDGSCEIAPSQPQDYGLFGNTPDPSGFWTSTYSMPFSNSRRCGRLLLMDSFSGSVRDESSSDVKFRDCGTIVVSVYHSHVRRPQGLLRAFDWLCEKWHGKSAAHGNDTEAVLQRLLEEHLRARERLDNAGSTNGGLFLISRFGSRETLPGLERISTP